MTHYPADEARAAREPRPSRTDAALDAGYSPHRDDNAPIPAHLRLAPDDPWMQALDAAYADVRADRCAVCHTTVDLDWSAEVCEHDVVTCGACDVTYACTSCREEGA